MRRAYPEKPRPGDANGPGMACSGGLDSMVWQELPALGSELEGGGCMPMWGAPGALQVGGDGLEPTQHCCYCDWAV
jgi:hypothetical protein